MLDDTLVAPAVPHRPLVAAIWNVLGSPHPELRAWSDFRPLWRQVPAAEIDSLLCHLYDKFCTFGYIGLQHPDGAIENAQGERLLDHAVHHPVDAWTDQGVALASIFWLFESSATLLTEYNQRLLDVDELKRFLAAKLDRYRSLADATTSPQDGDVVSLSRQVHAARAAIPAGYVRTFSIDGETWEREERYLDARPLDGRGLDARPLDGRQGDDVYPVVCAAIRTHLGFDLPAAATARQRFEALVDRVTANGINPFEILVAIANAALADTVLQADYAVITVPQGEGLDAPWNLQIPDVCSYAVVRQDFDPAKEGVEFQRQQIIRIIEQRMRFNTSCRSKNYHPDRVIRRKAQPFQFPDIAHGESSHHRGHIKAGIKSSARTHFEIRIPSLVQYGEFRGFGDLRVNRADDSPARHYSFDELRHLLPYGDWCKAAFDYALANGHLMDRKYCTGP